MRKGTVGIDILVTPRNGDRKIMQSIRITRVDLPPEMGSGNKPILKTSTKVIPIEKT